MILALAVLLLQAPTILSGTSGPCGTLGAAPAVAVVAEAAEADSTPSAAAPASAVDPRPDTSGNAAENSTPDSRANPVTESLPATESLEEPQPKAEAFVAAEPIPGRTSRGSISVAELRQEYRPELRRKQRDWLVMGAVEHGAATFDAWSTRRAISSGQAQELDPLLQPFAGNGSLYAAVQVGPLAFDYVGRRMLTSRHRWERRTWWVPQALSTAFSIASGAHNLGGRATP
jgi:hypothetical protein